MTLLAAKLLAAPLLILWCSLAARRWGDAVGGWLVGLPLTSGPVALFLALEQGPDFVVQSSAGSLVGVAGQAFFCMAYGAMAATGWPAALVAGTLAYVASVGILVPMHLSHAVILVLCFAALALALLSLPRRQKRGVRVPHPWWDLPARMVTVTVLVIVLTSLAEVLGDRLSGVLPTFPVMAMALTVFAHRIQGSASAIEVLRGMAASLYGFAMFFLVLGRVIAGVSLPVAFAAAIAAALLTQAVSWQVMRFITGRAPA